jgi:hypothetical protein
MSISAGLVPEQACFVQVPIPQKNRNKYCFRIKNWLLSLKSKIKIKIDNKNSN